MTKLLAVIYSFISAVGFPEVYQRTFLNIKEKQELTSWKWAENNDEKKPMSLRNAAMTSSNLEYTIKAPLWGQHCWFQF